VLWLGIATRLRPKISRNSALRSRAQAANPLGVSSPPILPNTSATRMMASVYRFPRRPRQSFSRKKWEYKLSTSNTIPSVSCAKF
jgi:hypothetical protein